MGFRKEGVDERKIMKTKQTERVMGAFRVPCYVVCLIFLCVDMIPLEDGPKSGFVLLL